MKKQQNQQKNTGLEMVLEQLEAQELEEIVGGCLLCEKEPLCEDGQCDEEA